MGIERVVPACGLESDEGEDSEGDRTSSDRFLRGGDAADGGGTFSLGDSRIRV